MADLGLVACQLPDFPAGFDVPDLDDLVNASGRKSPIIGREADGPDLVGVAA